MLREGAATPKHKLEHMVVVLPGILGSVLAKDGRDVWALSSQAIFKGLLSLGQSIKDLAVVDDDPEAEDLGDGVTAPRLMSDMHFAPGLWKVDRYSKLIATIQETFDIQPGVNYFDFPYDWRRDNRATAKRLRSQTAEWLSTWRDVSNNPGAKIVFLAHSMGGLVARYFIECEERGIDDTYALFTFGTPYSGSLNALNFLANGYRKGLGPIRLLDLSAFLRSLTSVYQLLPTYKCYDSGDGELVRVGEVAGIPNVDADRAADALAFHREITDQAADHSGRYSIRPIVGINQPTWQSARFDGNDAVIVEHHLGGEDLAGDGTVPRPSATPSDWEEEQDRAVFYSSEVHGWLQNSGPVLTQVIGVLTGTYDRDKYRESIDVQLGMGMPDWLEPDVGVEITVEARPVFDKTAETRVQIVVENVDAVGEDQSQIEEVLEPMTPTTVELPGLHEGVYRVRTKAVGVAATPVTDILAVVANE